MKTGVWLLCLLVVLPASALAQSARTAHERIMDPLRDFDPFEPPVTAERYFPDEMEQRVRVAMVDALTRRAEGLRGHLRYFEDKDKERVAGGGNRSGLTHHVRELHHGNLPDRGTYRDAQREALAAAPPGAPQRLVRARLRRDELGAGRVAGGRAPHRALERAPEPAARLRGPDYAGVGLLCHGGGGDRVHGSAAHARAAHAGGRAQGFGALQALRGAFPGRPQERRGGREGGGAGSRPERHLEIRTPDPGRQGAGGGQDRRRRVSRATGGRRRSEGAGGGRAIAGDRRRPDGARGRPAPAAFGGSRRQPVRHRTAGVQGRPGAALRARQGRYRGCLEAGARHGAPLRRQAPGHPGQGRTGRGPGVERTARGGQAQRSTRSPAPDRRNASSGARGSCWTARSTISWESWTGRAHATAWSRRVSCCWGGISSKRTS